MIDKKLIQIVEELNIDQFEKDRLIKEFNLTLSAEFLGFLAQNHKNKFNEIYAILNKEKSSDKIIEIDSFIQTLFSDKDIGKELNALYNDCISNLERKVLKKGENLNE